MSGSAGIVETLWMREAFLPFKADESKLVFVFMSKALANTGTLSNTRFSTLKEKRHLVPASGLNLVNKEPPPGSRREKKNSGDQATRAQGQVQFTSCIYIKTAHPPPHLLPKINQTV